MYKVKPDKDSPEITSPPEVVLAAGTTQAVPTLLKMATQSGDTIDIDPAEKGKLQPLQFGSIPICTDPTKLAAMMEKTGAVHPKGLKEAPILMRDYATATNPLLLVTRAKIPGYENAGDWRSLFIFDTDGRGVPHERVCTNAAANKQFDASTSALVRHLEASNKCRVLKLVCARRESTIGGPCVPACACVYWPPQDPPAEFNSASAR